MIAHAFKLGGVLVVLAAMSGCKDSGPLLCPLDDQPFTTSSCMATATRKITEVVNLSTEDVAGYNTAYIQYKALQAQMDMLKETELMGRYTRKNVYSDTEAFNTMQTTLDELMTAKLREAEGRLNIPPKE